MAHHGHAPGHHTPTINSFDEAETTCGQFLPGSVSMDVANDPRFFTKNVMDKRLSAFHSLTMISGLMFGFSVGLCYHLKKDMSFSSWEPYVGNIAIWQAVAFMVSVVVCFMCLISLYVIAHQLFYAYRLMTAGPTGFEQASMFYLTKEITIWRHFAIKCLFNGLWMFMVLLGIQLFVKFYKDADGEKKGPHMVWVMNMIGGTSQNKTVVSLEKHHKLNMTEHTILGYIVFVMFILGTCVLYYVRAAHLRVFRDNYTSIKALTDPIRQNAAQMSKRSSMSLDA